MNLSPSQLRLISTIGMGVLVGTSLIVIIPEGIEAIYAAGSPSHGHMRRNIQARGSSVEVQWASTGIAQRAESIYLRDTTNTGNLNIIPNHAIRAADEEKTQPPVIPVDKEVNTPEAGKDVPALHEDEDHQDPPTFFIGLSLITGFVLMFLIDKLPRHASESLQTPAQPRHISLGNLSQGLHSTTSLSDDLESEGFLQSFTPSPKVTRSLATTTGLVIHAFADGIAMGASSTSSDSQVGFIIFLAIMIHKAPAAFGLTSVLLKQGLSKRAARGHLIIFSLASPFGALSTYLLVSLIGGDHMEGQKGQWWTGMLLLFSAGTFL
jgi:zinc transporter 9